MNLEASRSLEPGSRTGLFRFAQFMVLAVAFLLLAGAAVKSTESGLSVPDWPLSFGGLMPPMEGGVFYEHGHRMVATAVGFLTLILAGWLWVREPRAWLRRLGLTAVGLVILQGVLGGVTVLLKLPLLVSVGHAVIAQSFFVLIVFIALALSKGWNHPPRNLEPTQSKLPALSAFTTIAIFVQLILGAVTRHLEAGLVIPDFPLAFGQVVPPVFTLEIGVHYAHRVGALVILVLAASLFVSFLKLPAAHQQPIKKPVIFLAVLVPLQILLGATIIWTARSLHPTNTHLVVGATLLATGVVITVRSFRIFNRRPVKAAISPSKLSQVPA